MEEKKKKKSDKAPSCNIDSVLLLVAIMLLKLPPMFYCKNYGFQLEEDKSKMTRLIMLMGFWYVDEMQEDRVEDK